MRPLFFFFLLTISQCFAQTYSIPVDLGDDEGASAIITHSSGDYFIGGFHNDSTMVARLNPNGTVIWIKTYDFGPNTDYISSMQFTSTGDIIGVGAGYNTSSPQSYYGFAFRLDINGTPIWKRYIKKGSTLTIVRALEEEPNGNYLCAGVFYNSNSKSNAFVMELDNLNGDRIWDSTYYQSQYNNGTDEDLSDLIYSSVNNSFYSVGRYQTGGGSLTYRPLLTKLNALGEREWTKIYNYTAGSSGGRLYSNGIDVDGDSLIMTIQGKNGGTSSIFDIGFIKTDLNGNSSWVRWYTSSNGASLRMYEVKNFSNGYIFSGRTENQNQDLFLIRTDKLGNIVWAKTYGTAAQESYDINQADSRTTIDGNYVVTTGWSEGYSSSKDILLLKVDIATGLIDNGLCSSDLLLNEINLPNYSEILPLINSGANISNTALVNSFNSITHTNSNNIKESISDSIASNDTYFLCPGESVSVYAEGSNNLNYQWSNGATSPAINLSTSGTYYVDVLSGTCLLWSDTVHVQAEDILPVNLGADTVLCNSSDTLFFNVFQPGVDYLWQDGTTNPTYNVSSSGTYFVSLDINGCTVGDTINVNYVNLQSIDLGSDTSLCFPDTLNLDATVNDPGVSYEWQDGSISSSYNVSGPGIYSVILDLNGCIVGDTINVDYVNLQMLDLGSDTVICSPDTLNLDATVNEPGVSYEWQDGSINSSYNVSSSGIYSVLLELNGCSIKDSIEVTYVNLPPIDLGSDTSLCFPDTLNLDATVNEPGVSYEWQDGSINSSYSVSNSGIYSVILDLNGCIVGDTIDVSYTNLQSLDLGSDTILCPQDTLILDASVSQSGVNYIWQDDSSTPTYSVNSPGVYSVTLLLNGCTMSDTLEVTFDSLPPVDLGPDTSLCFSDTLILDASTASSGINYLWQDGSTNSTHYVYNSGTYYVDIERNGCVNSDTLVAVYLSVPTLDLENQELCEGENLEINLDDKSTSYEWQDGSTEALYNIYESGTYSVFASNECGIDSATFSVSYTNCECDLFVPNTFTPDNNKINDAFKVVGNCQLEFFELVIFNRWGEIIYESNEIIKEWDGSYLGLPVKDGTYIWKIKYKFIEDPAESISGHVNVLR